MGITLVNSKSTNSALLVWPSGKALAMEIRGNGLKPSVWASGNAARLAARWKNRCKSKWEIRLISPSLPNLRRMRWTLGGMIGFSREMGGTSGGGITSLCPNSGPQTPHSEQPPKEQSGIVCAAIALSQSSISHCLSIPVSIWSQGKGSGIFSDGASQIRPASAIACVHAPKAFSVFSNHESMPAPNCHARYSTLPKRRSPRPTKSSIALIRTSV